MKHNFTTCFDVNYLSKGIAMIRSLLHHSPDAKVFVLAMDSATMQTLLRVLPPDTPIIDMEMFEKRTGMDEIRKTRTWQEYCWSVGSVFTDLVARTRNIDVTYLDADVFLFQNPQVVFDEIGDKSIGITPHRFAKVDEARLLPNGKYCVQWATFRGQVGRKCLAEWSANVKAWCFYKHSEDGTKFGDQKFLDYFERDYPGEVCEIKNIGVGVAPWNFGQYILSEGPRVNDVPIVLFHAHEYVYGKQLTKWQIPYGAKELIYGPYSKAIEEAHELINAQTVRL